MRLCLHEDGNLGGLAVAAAAAVTESPHVATSSTLPPRLNLFEVSDMRGTAAESASAAVIPGLHIRYSMLRRRSARHFYCSIAMLTSVNTQSDKN